VTEVTIVFTSTFTALLGSKSRHVWISRLFLEARCRYGKEYLSNTASAGGVWTTEMCEVNPDVGIC